MSKRKQSRDKISETLHALAGVIAAYGFKFDHMMPAIEIKKVAMHGSVVGADGFSHVAGSAILSFFPIPASEFKPDTVQIERFNRKLADLGFKGQQREVADPPPPPPPITP